MPAIPPHQRHLRAVSPIEMAGRRLGTGVGSTSGVRTVRGLSRAFPPQAGAASAAGGWDGLVRRIGQRILDSVVDVHSETAESITPGHLCAPLGALSPAVLTFLDDIPAAFSARHYLAAMTEFKVLPRRLELSLRATLQAELRQRPETTDVALALSTIVQAFGQMPDADLAAIVNRVRPTLFSFSIASVNCFARITSRPETFVAMVNYLGTFRHIIVGYRRIRVCICTADGPISGM